MRGNPPLSGIDTNDNRVTEPAACLLNQIGIFHSGCAQDNALYTGLKPFFYCIYVPDATTQLGRDQYCAANLLDNIQISRPATGSAIKVNDMQPGCSQRLPSQSDLYRVIREDSLLVVITLVQANAVTTSNVYGRDYFYLIYLAG